MDKKQVEIIQKQLRSGKSLPLMDTETWKYAKKPLGKAIYKANVGRPKKEEHVDRSDRIKCDICGKIITRSARTNHNKTKYHQMYKNVEEKLRKILIDN